MVFIIARILVLMLLCWFCSNQIRVPTHEDGSCLFWEFATDGYDIGFGVYFEWSLVPGNQVSVHVCESSEEEEEEDEGQGQCFIRPRALWFNE